MLTKINSATNTAIKTNTNVPTRSINLPTRSIHVPTRSIIGDDCRSIIFRNPIQNMAMEDRVIRKMEVPNEGSCRVMCYLEPDCVSINVGPIARGNQKCELNNATKENHAPFLLVNKPAYTYFAIENRCSSSPCLNDAMKKTCAEIYNEGEKRDGIYTLKPDNLTAFDVFCDQTTAGGGWTVFQKRLNGSVDFYRSWNDYKHGFGDLHGEFWLGLDKIHRLTSNNNFRLRVDLHDFEGNIRHAEYNLFGVMNDNDKYKLILGS
ncbi:Fibrinogen C domain-containing protein 1 [Stylophora pistillata]|uniref:Fibrinogen C domain-containing protein 1 n=1 Tax=Stylophora pistillata TaxID=50429 RepID=A0A2B4RK38_STYPI|nr:Fibrinogen C domain-containing protein 1 [Stylophora pistillata]